MMSSSLPRPEEGSQRDIDERSAWWRGRRRRPPRSPPLSRIDVGGRDLGNPVDETYAANRSLRPGRLWSQIEEALRGRLQGPARLPVVVGVSKKNLFWGQVRATRRRCAQGRTSDDNMHRCPAGRTVRVSSTTAARAARPPHAKAMRRRVWGVLRGHAYNLRRSARCPGSSRRRNRGTG